jgi:ribonuclease HI
MKFIKNYNNYILEYSELSKHETLYIYTDGSHDQIKNTISFGSVLFADEKEYYLSNKYNSINLNKKYNTQLNIPLSSLSAELIAVEETLSILYFYKIKNKNIIIYLDNESVFNQFNNNQPKIKYKSGMQPILNKIYYLLTKLQNKNNKIEINWIPGHKQIYGNMQANYLASKGQNLNTFKVFVNMVDRFFEDPKKHSWFKNI